MNVSIPKTHLLHVLAAAGNAVKENAAMAILSHVRLEASDGILITSGTNLDQYVQAGTECQVTVPGGLAVPSKKLLAIVRELDGDISLTAEANVLTVESGGCRFELKGLDVSEFPPEPTMEGGESVELLQKDLLQMLGLTSFAASTDESRLVLNGCLLVFTPAKLECVGCDGRRVAVATRAVAHNVTRQIILPSRAVTELLRLLNEEGNVTLEMAEDKARFTVGDSTFTTVLHAGNFPDYRKVFPQSNGQGVSLERAGLLGAMRRVNILTQAGVLHFRGNVLTVRSQAAADEQQGKAQETMLVATRPDLSIAFNLDYMIEAMKLVNADNLDFHATAADAPALLLAPDHGWEYVVMPMRLDDAA